MKKVIVFMMPKTQEANSILQFFLRFRAPFNGVVLDSDPNGPI